MNVNPNIDKPIFIQIAEQLEDSIFTGIFPEETQIPSTNEISALLSINPHTVLKGMNVLVDEEIIYKKRGLGMFVKEGAVEKKKQKRRARQRRRKGRRSRSRTVIKAKRRFAFFVLRCAKILSRKVKKIIDSIKKMV